MSRGASKPPKRYLGGAGPVSEVQDIGESLLNAPEASRSVRKVAMPWRRLPPSISAALEMVDSLTGGAASNGMMTSIMG